MDYSNAIYMDMKPLALRKLHLIQNYAVSLLSNMDYHEHIRPDLLSLYTGFL